MKKLVMVVEFEDNVSLQAFEEFGRALQQYEGIKATHAAEVPEQLLHRHKIVMEGIKVVD